MIQALKSLANAGFSISLSTLLWSCVLPTYTNSSQDDNPDTDSGACTPIVPGPCNHVLQCGCSGTDGCYLTWRTPVETETVCARSINVPVGLACLHASDCVPGAGCPAGLCMSYCNEDSDCPGIGSLCAQFNNNGVPIVGGKFCTDHCEPWSPSSCPEGYDCAIANGGARPGTFSCAPAGPDTTGCEADLACPNGHLCFLDGRYRKACRVSAQDCPDGVLCHAFIGGV
ncbi:MAG: hypothetical protein FWD57_16980, partial [Polyangiaceae bacterium]|nr:hypothetical protein [Polyangiaceae bacterium]